MSDFDADEFPMQTGNFFSVYTDDGDTSDDTLWTVHESPVVKTYDSAWFGEREIRWTLKVCDNGIVQTSRTVPYNGTRVYSTQDRPNRADKSSQFRLSVEEVLDRHAEACIDTGEPIEDGDRDDYVATLRERVRAVLGRDDVATNGPMGADLLADGGTDGRQERANFGPLKPKSEVADADYCAQYLVPASECVLSDGETCPHDVLNASDEQADDGGRS